MEVSGTDVPNPILSLEVSNFPPEIVSLLSKKGITIPTPIQAQGWPVTLKGNDLIGIAQTGSGKTLSFILPAFIHILTQKRNKRSSIPYVLVLAPTRELAVQIETVAKEYGRVLGIRTGCVFGGAPRGDQIRTIQGGIDLLVATPGRLIDFIEAKEVKMVACSYVVLDEADRMLDMGFEPQLRRINEVLRKDRQTLMWSATWPKEVERLSKEFLNRKYTSIRVGKNELTANKNIKQNIVLCKQPDKEKELSDILFNMYEEAKGKSIEFPKIIIFVNTKRTVDDLVDKLKEDGWPSAGIHGDKSQRDRDRVIYNFRNGRIRVMVATEVAARGLDIDDIKCVINVDFPNNIEDYIHRIGRTSRGDLKNGIAYTMFTAKDSNNAKDLVKILKQAGQVIPDEILNMSNRANYNGGNNRSRYGGNQRRSNYGRGGAGSGTRDYDNTRRHSRY
eukprot:GHVP01023813.1.p1 GENE.GHVP01023813.1~~GHVP01023813.1.p1  ORF type:complete len:508 (+),score=97.94 GHVP01023813.1:185-1525(+)